MACDRRTRLLISCYADGETTPSETAKAKAHLETCPECRALIDQWSGEKAVFQWAYTSQIPEETTQDWRESLAGKAPKMSTATTKPASRKWPRLKWPTITLPTLVRRPINWAIAGLVTAAVIAGLMIYQTTTLPPMIGVGATITAAATAQPARMGEAIELTIGPNSRVTRMDETSLRLEEGWVSAEVRRAKLRILSPRLEVIDKGTRFRVGTGPKMDYVIVEEGEVTATHKKTSHTLSAGQVLFAGDDGKVQLGSLPQDDEPTSDQHNQLSNQTDRFVFAPDTDFDLKEKEGLLRLASQYPEVHYTGSGRSVARNNGVQYEFGYDTANFSKTLRKHFVDIAQALTGSPGSATDWEFPVAILTLSGVKTDRVLPLDVYLLRLISQDGRVFWRLNGSLGNQADFPLLDIKPDTDGSGDDRIRYDFRWWESDSSTKNLACDIWLPEWPGETKLTLRIELTGRPQVDTEHEQRAILAEAERLSAGTKGLKLDFRRSSLLYLDPEREHKLLIAWNKNAGKQLCELSDLSQKRRSGAVYMGVIVTDTPIAEPQLDAGAYLLRLSLDAPSNKPRIELESIGPNKQRYLLRTAKRKSEDTFAGGGENCQTTELPGYGKSTLSCKTGKADGDAYPFLFQVVGDPSDKSTAEVKNSDGSVSYMNPNKPWAEAYIRIKKP